ncbi:MAG TPA: serine/threonine-protein kinase [Sandaracinaceae bacterium LLY-WYZ-13_1]|nr:serine/threonine-protein kinase [Sandaracinaceae bacterium LLY-WYZ-13_1]
MRADAQIGREIAHFRIVAPLGQGGMGVVYRAEDRKLRRPVALKVLPPERTADEASRRRFLREARSAAAVTHPCIATIYEVGEDDDGTVYIAMEMVEGHSLREVLAEGPPPLQDTLAIAVDVARGLARAHRAGIVHRDIKPDNVMIDPEGQVKILDFGLAKLRAGGPEHPAEDRITTGVRVAGTPEYMSPEQARGAEVGPASDVFSLGVLLHEMISGTRPFTGESSLAVIASVLRDEPAPLEGVPAPLADLVARCLAKDPTARPPDARAVERALSELRGADRVTVSVPPGRPSSAADDEVALLPTLVAPTIDTRPVETGPAAGPRRSPVVVLVGAAALVAAGSVVAWLVWGGDRAEPADPSARAPRSADPAPAPTPLIDPDLESVVDDPPERVLRHAAVSPDGATLALSRDDALHLRDLATGRERPLAMPDGSHPVHAEWIRPAAEALLVMSIAEEGGTWAWRVPVDGEEPTRLFRASMAVPSPTNDDIVYATSGKTPCEVRLRTGDGRDRLLHRGGCEDGILAWTPDGEGVAMLDTSDDPEVPGQIRLLDRVGSARVLLRSARLELHTTAAPLAFLPDGCLATFLAAPPPAQGCALHRVCPDHPPDEEPPLLVRFDRGSAQALGFDRDGRTYVLLMTSDADVQIAPLDEDGRPGELAPVVDGPREDRDAAFVDDDTLVFHSNRTGRYALHRVALSSGEVSVVFDPPLHATYPVPTPAGLLHWQTRATDEGAQSTTSLHRVGLDGRGDVEILPPREVAFYAAAQPSRRTSRVACAGSECWLGERAGGVYRLQPLEEAGGGEAIVVHGTGFMHAVAPGGDRVAVARDASLVVLDRSGRRQRTVASVDEGQLHAVAWHPNGRWLYAARVGGAPIFELLRVAADGSEVTTHYGSSHTWIGSPAVAPSGTRLAVSTKTFDSNVVALSLPAARAER